MTVGRFSMGLVPSMKLVLSMELALSMKLVFSMELVLSMNHMDYAPSLFRRLDALQFALPILTGSINLARVQRDAAEK